MRVVLAAEEAAGIQTLRALEANEGVELLYVLTSAPSGSKRGVVVADVASQMGHDVLDARLVKDASFGRRLRDDGVDLLVNVHSLYVIHGDVVAAPGIGSFNLHPGPLPGYAGLNAPSWAIFNGEARHAVTLHWMEAGVDTGAIAYEAWFDLDASSTGLSASTQCVRLGVPLVGRLVDAALEDPMSIPRNAQGDGERRYYRRRDIPFDGAVDWTLPARTLDAYFRAAEYHPMPSPWGHPRTGLGGEPVDIVRGRDSGVACEVDPGTVGEAADDGKSVRVASGDRWIDVFRVRTGSGYHAGPAVLRAGMRLELGQS